MTDDEICIALKSFSSVWQRVGGKNSSLPDTLVLLPGKDGKPSPYLR